MWRFPNADKHDPEILEALRRMEAKEESQRQVRFDQLYADLQFSWSKLKSQPVLSAFCTVRDKLTAHTEIRFIADKYQLIDIGKLGIKWGDLKVVIAQMQHLVELIGLVVRNAGFAWDMLDEDLNEAANGFWVSEPDS